MCMTRPHKTTSSVCCAEAGECDKNEPFMRGSNGAPGQCRLACGVCVPCAPGDVACADAARREQGYLPDLAGELAELFPEGRR